MHQLVPRLFVALALALGWSSPRPCAGQSVGTLDALIEPIRDRAGLPALAAAVVRSNRIIGAGAVGVRKAGGTQAVTLHDRFHIGSCTKSMTATVAAMFVEAGTLSWQTTIEECFSDWREVLHADYRAVTLDQLLSNRAGTPGDLVRTPAWARAWAHVLDAPRQQRALLVTNVLARAPEAKPGTRYIYSNAGFAIAGHMLERRTDRPWEELLREKLFGPLGMTNAGFGAAATPGQVDQPWGHRLAGGRVVPVPPGPRADNPAAIGPAGTVHCSVLDFAVYANFHLQGARGQKGGLKPETFSKLHTPAGDGSYALGWFVAKRSWAKGRTLSHVGSNTMNTAVVWIAPEIDFAVVVMTNLGGAAAEKACDDTAAQLIRHFLN